MNRSLAALTFAAALGALGALVYTPPTSVVAAPPYPGGIDPATFMQVLSPDWGADRVLPNNGVWMPITFRTDVGYQPAVFGWDTVVTLTATTAGPVACCWAMTSTLTIGGAGSSTLITDANGADGPGACFAVPPGGILSVRPRFPVIANRPGARTGVCTTPSTNYTSSLQAVYPPCRVDGDCTDAASAGTCAASPSSDRKLQSGAFLLCMSPYADNSNIRVWTER